MAEITIQHEPFAPPGFQFCAFEEGAPAAWGVGLGATAEQAVAGYLKGLPADALEEARWAAATFGESAAWIELMKAERADRREG